jgi:NTE family protein
MMPKATVAFVLGGGGKLGAAEVGMLRALVDAGIEPDMVIGTSIGALNGVAIAADPRPAGVDALQKLWSEVDQSGVFGGGIVDRIRHLAANRTSLHSNEPLERLLADVVGTLDIGDLPVRFECVAACIETAGATWFDSGPAVSAVLASCAVPGLLPPVQIDGLHYLDGGIVDSIPVRRAVEQGATQIYVLQVGRIERPLEVPRRPQDVATVAFEIARRHSFTAAMEHLPPEVTVHVLPTGGSAPKPSDLRQLRYRDFADVSERIESARAASDAYLVRRGLVLGGSGTTPDDEVPQ